MPEDAARFPVDGTAWIRFLCYLATVERMNAIHRDLQNGVICYCTQQLVFSY